VYSVAVFNFIPHRDRVLQRLAAGDSATPALLDQFFLPYLAAATAGEVMRVRSSKAGATLVGAARAGGAAAVDLNRRSQSTARADARLGPSERGPQISDHGDMFRRSFSPLPGSPSPPCSAPQPSLARQAGAPACRSRPSGSTDMKRARSRNCRKTRCTSSIVDNARRDRHDRRRPRKRAAPDGSHCFVFARPVVRAAPAQEPAVRRSEDFSTSDRRGAGAHCSASGALARARAWPTVLSHRRNAGNCLRIVRQRLVRPPTGPRCLAADPHDRLAWPQGGAPAIPTCWGQA